MPTHVYKPVHDLPSWWDRLLVHPLDTTGAVVAFTFGLVVSASMAIPAFVPSKSLAVVPAGLVILVGVFLVAGGALALIGLYWSGDEVSHGWALERFGWLLNFGGLVTYAASVFGYNTSSIFAWTVPLLLGVGGLLRFWSLVQIERATRSTIAQVIGDIA